jgi:HPt (histidine-containing phosphotransfer) domain-containing protein
LEQKIKTAYAQQDWPQLTANAHTLKSSARAIGAITLGNVCNLIETHAKTKELASLTKAMQLFAIEFDDVKWLLTNRLSKE